VSSYPSIAENIAIEYDSYDGFIVICDTDLLPYISAMLSFALCNLGKSVIVVSPTASIDGRVSGGIEVDHCLKHDFITDFVAAINLVINSKIKFQGVFVLYRQGIYSSTCIKSDNTVNYEEKGHFLGMISSQIKIDVDGLKSYEERYQPFASNAQKLILKNKFDYNNTVCTLKPFGNHWNVYLNIVEQEKCKAICLIAEHFSFVGNFDSFGNKSLIDFFNYCKENRIAIIIIKDPFVTSEYRNYYIAEQIAQYGGIPVVGTFECTLIKVRWLLGQGVKYEELHSEMRRNIKGEFGRYVIV